MEPINVQEVTAVLDFLIKEKQKKKSNKDMIAKYSENWLKLAKEKGMSNEVVRYFYDGYILIGPEPFKEFLDSNKQNSERIVSALLANDQLNNVDRKFAMVNGILAVLLNDESTDPLVIKAILLKYVRFCKNKEGRVAKSAPGSLLVQLAKKINIEAKFFPVEKLGLPSSLTNEIVKVMIDQFEKNDGVKAHDKQRMLKVVNWLSGISTTDKAEPVVQEKIEPATPLNTDKVNSPVSGTNSNSMVKPQTAPKTLAELARDVAKEMVFISNRIDSVTSSYNSRIIALEKQIEDKNREIALLKRDNNNTQTSLEFLKSKNKELETDLEKAIKDVKENLIALSEKDNEIKHLESVVAVLESKTDTEIKQILNKKANDLKPNYKDYLDLKKQPISTETSEIAMIILEDMFDRLEKLGIKVK